MFAAGLSIFNSLYFVQAMLPTFVDELGMSEAEAALAVSATTGMLALFIVPASILSERFGRGRVLVISAPLAAAVGLALPLATNGAQLIALRAVQGVAIAGTPAVAMTWISEEMSPSAAPGAMGLYVSGSSIGGLLGRLIPAFAVDFVGWRWAVLLASLSALACSVAMAFLLPAQRNFTPKPLRVGREFSAMANHLRNPRLLGLYAVGFLGMGTFVSVYNMFGFRAVDFFGLPAALSALIYLTYLSGTWSSARAGRYIRTFGRGRVVLGTAVIMLVGSVLLVSSSLWATVIGLLGFTAAFFALHSGASGWVGQVASRDRAEASSLYLLFYYVGSSVVGAATGWLFMHVGWGGFTAAIVGLLVVLVGVTVALALAERAEGRERK
ncbi:MFS transporter [Corynebacterium aquatimens]|nr:MFS transporter [Corynebacterium aquatimens]WJY66851.1 Inner membrane transport protein YnfM [Corynebacterium aquatimens]